MSQMKLIADAIEELSEATGTRIDISDDMHYLYVWSDDRMQTTQFQLPTNIPTLTFLSSLSHFLWVAISSGALARVQVLKDKGLLV